VSAALRARDRPAADLSLSQRDAAKLATLIRECQVAGISRRACVVHLSRLPPNRVRPHHLRMARAALEPLAQADRGRMFTLPSLDLVVVWRNASEAAVRESRAAVTLLFARDEDSVQATAALWEEIALPADAQRLLSMAETEADAEEIGGLAPPVEEAVPPPPGMPLDPAALASLEANLAQADVTRFARRQPVALRLPDGRFRLRWERRVLHLGEIAETLAPGYALKDDGWLFRKLTRTLDRRMLALLAAPGELDLAGPFSLNLNVASILAPEFLRFDAALPLALRGQVVIDLHPPDILADPGAYLFARDFARERGYQLALHGVSAEVVALLPRTLMALDWLTLRWSEALFRTEHQAITSDAAHLVLSHADDAAAIAWGVAHGIALFHGRVVNEAVRGAGKAGI
jgi:hypothetical protein